MVTGRELDAQTSAIRRPRLPAPMMRTGRSSRQDSCGGVHFGPVSLGLAILRGCSSLERMNDGRGAVVERWQAGPRWRIGLGNGLLGKQCSWRTRFWRARARPFLTSLEAGIVELAIAVRSKGADP